MTKCLIFRRRSFSEFFNSIRQEQSFADPKSNRRNRPKAEFQLTILDDGIGPRHGDSTISKNDNKPLLTYNQIASTL
jgi:hypothetical protein